MKAHFACRHISGTPVTGDSPCPCWLLTDIQRDRATSATALRITGQQFLISSLWLRRKPQLCTFVITTFSQLANPSGTRYISNRPILLPAGAPVHTACGAQSIPDRGTHPYRLWGPLDSRQGLPSTPIVGPTQPLVQRTAVDHFPEIKQRRPEARRSAPSNAQH
jgi:hypothetical protein